MITVLDTNIIISSLLFRGQAARLHVAMLEGRIHPIICPSIESEYRAVLAYAKFGLSAADVQYLINEEILPYAISCPEPKSQKTWIPADPSDDCFIRLAIEHPHALVISGDRHILDVRDSLPCKVLSLAECLEKI